VNDHGARALSAVASLLEIEDEENATEEDVQKLVDQVPDPAGLFYMYSLPLSQLRRSK